MPTHSLTTALTLYRSGTLTLAQAARKAGMTERELAVALDRHGISVRESLTPPEAAGDRQPTLG